LTNLIPKLKSLTGKQGCHDTGSDLGHRLAQKFGVDIKKNLITVLEDIRLRNITQIAVTGDIAENDECVWFFDTIKEYGFEMHLVLGNHDNPSAMELA
jgi:Icc protein